MSRPRLSEQRITLIEDRLGCGFLASDVLADLGMSPGAVMRMCCRAGRYDLWQRLQTSDSDGYGPSARCQKCARVFHSMHALDGHQATHRQAPS